MEQKGCLADVTELAEKVIDREGMTREKWNGKIKRKENTRVWKQNALIEINLFLKEMTRK